MTEALEYVIRLRGGPEAAADVRRVEAAVKSTGGSMKTLGRESEEAGHKLGKATSGIKSVGKALIAAGAGFLAWEAGKKAFDFTEELVKSTKQLTAATGMSTAESSRWAGVTAAVGGNAGQSAMAFQKLANAAEKQELATKKQVAAGKLANSTVIAGTEPLERLGISTAYLEKHQRNLGPVMELVVDRISKNNNATEKASVLTNLFGRGWKQLSPILLEGKKHLDDLLSTAKEMGVELKGNSADALENLREKQIRASLATEALRLRFTEIAAKPMGDLLQGFSALTLAIQKNEWGKFDKQAQKIGDTFTKIAETILPHVAENFAHMAPIVLSAFAHGFAHASLGGEAIIAGLLFSKLGLTSVVFTAAGGRLAKNFSGAFSAKAVPAVAKSVEKTAVVTGAEEAAMTEAGMTLGSAFSVALVGAAAGVGLGVILNKIFPNGIFGHKEHSPKEAEAAISGKNNATYVNSAGEIAPKRGFAHTEAGGGETRPAGGKVRVYDRLTHEYVYVRPGETLPAHKGEAPKPAGAPHHSLAVTPFDRGPGGHKKHSDVPENLIINLDGRRVGRMNLRQALEAQAAGE